MENSMKYNTNCNIWKKLFLFDFMWHYNTILKIKVPKASWSLQQCRRQNYFGFSKNLSAVFLEEQFFIIIFFSVKNNFNNPKNLFVQ